MSQLHSSNHGEETLEEKVPAWQTGAANAERQRKNRAAKKHVRQQRDSKKIVDESEVKADAVNDVMKEEEEEKKVVHPWHLSSVKHAWVDQWTVRVDDKDNGAGVYKVAQYADNLKGSGLYRTEVGVGIVSLPRVWGNKTYIKKACDPLVGEALGKRDLDLKYLVPRALVNLKTHINSWPGIELEIVEYLTSREFANLLTAHYERLLERTSELVLAKTYRFAASINATKREVLLAATLYNNPRWLMVEAAMLCFFIFGLLACSWYISYTAFITSVCVSVVVVALFRRRQGVTPNVLRILYELQKES